MLLENIVGSDARLKILIYLSRTAEAYQRQIELTLGLPLFAVQSQLKALEREGLVRRWKVGNRYYYAFRADYPLYREIRNLFRKAGRISKPPRAAAKRAKARKR